MKKIFFTLFLCSALVFAYAQDGSDSQYKQYSGARNLEVQFTPLGGSPISIGGIRFRSFTSETSALRLNAFLGLSRDTDNSAVTDGNGDEVVLTDANSSFTLELRPGIENHFRGTERLSPYYGGEAVVGFRYSAASSESLDTDGTSIVKNKIKNQGNDGYFRIGANAVLGADYYFSKSIYLGTEVGFGLQVDFELDEVTVPDGGDKTTTSEGGSSINLGPNAIGEIRLGFLF